MTDVYVTLQPPCLCLSKGHKQGVSIESSTNFGDTLLQIMPKWRTAETWFLARLFIYHSSIVSQILDFIHWMVTILVLITWLVKTENSAFKTLPFPNETCSFHRINLKKNKLQIFTMLNILRRLWWYTWRLTIDDWLSPAGEEVYTKEKPYAEVFQG